MTKNRPQLPPLSQRVKDLVPCFIYVSEEQLEQAPLWLADLIDAKYMQPPNDIHDRPGWVITEPDCVLYVTLGYSAIDQRSFIHVLASDPPPMIARRIVRRLIERGGTIDSTSPLLDKFLEATLKERDSGPVERIKRDNY